MTSDEWGTSATGLSVEQIRTLLEAFKRGNGQRQITVESNNLGQVVASDPPGLPEVLEHFSKAFCITAVLKLAEAGRIQLSVKVDPERGVLYTIESPPEIGK